MNADVTAALKTAAKLKTIGRTPRLTYNEKLLAGAVLKTVAELASRTPATPLAKEMAWDSVLTTLEVYMENLPGGES